MTGIPNIESPAMLLLPAISSCALLMTVTLAAFPQLRSR